MSHFAPNILDLEDSQKLAARRVGLARGGPQKIRLLRSINFRKAQANTPDMPAKTCNSSGGVKKQSKKGTLRKEDRGFIPPPVLPEPLEGEDEHNGPNLVSKSLHCSEDEGERQEFIKPVIVPGPLHDEDEDQARGFIKFSTTPGTYNKEEDVDRPPESSDSSEDERERKAKIVSTTFGVGRESTTSKTVKTGNRKAATRRATKASSPTSSPATEAIREDVSQKRPTSSNPLSITVAKKKRKQETYTRRRKAKPSKVAPDTKSTPARSKSNKLSKASATLDSDDEGSFIAIDMSCLNDSTGAVSKTIDDSDTSFSLLNMEEEVAGTKPLPASDCKPSSARLNSLASHLVLAGRVVPSSSGERPDPTQHIPQQSQWQSFLAYNLDDSEELSDKAKGMLENLEDLHSSSLHNTAGNDDVPQASLARCPMCKEVVDPFELKSRGFMNTRAQEEFCRQHQKKTAQGVWEAKGYPVIDWEHIDDRIAQHHRYLKKLINGEDSHYRRILKNVVESGKDRSLLKMTSNLTPGYYGNRGLQVISENIMREFTPLLKKRIVKDRIISARGFTGYVQAVLVPEVTTLLIMEDMTVDIGEARDILAQSATMGELLQEELREVRRKVVDSEDDDDDDELAV